MRFAACWATTAHCLHRNSSGRYPEAAGKFCPGGLIHAHRPLRSYGKSGSRILIELLARGHQVTALVRDCSKLAAGPGLTVEQGNVASTRAIAEKIKGAEAVASAYAAPADDTDQLLAVTEHFIYAVCETGVPRFLFVGGAVALK